MQTCYKINTENICLMVVITFDSQVPVAFGLISKLFVIKSNEIQTTIRSTAVVVLYCLLLDRTGCHAIYHTEDNAEIVNTMDQVIIKLENNSELTV